ncbi:MAG: phage portal protein, partial [Candidatus Brocadiales bacterium]
MNSTYGNGNQGRPPSGGQVIFINNPQRVEDKRILGPNGMPIERSIEEFSRGWRDDHVTGGFFGGYDIWEAGLRPKRVGQLPASILRDIYRKSSAVRPAVDQISRSVAFAPWKLQPMEGHQASREDLMAVKEFLKNPNRTNESFSQLLYKALRDLLVLDVAVIEKVRNEEGRVVELFARDAATFTVSTDPTNSYITGFEQRLPTRDKNGLHIRYELRRFPPQDIVWIVLNPGTDTQYGYPIIETIVNEVAALLFSMKSIARYFTHDEIPPGILVFGRLGKEAFDRAKEWFRSRRGEEGKRELPMFWDVEGASYIPFQRPFREMQLAELSAQIERIVFRNFGVTSLEMGMTQDVNRATSFSLERLSHSKLITPLREMLSFFITQDIIWELHPGLQFKFSIGSYGDMPQIASSLVTLAGGPIISVNEA